MYRKLTIFLTAAFFASAVSVGAQQQSSSAPPQSQSAPAASSNSSSPSSTPSAPATAQATSSQAAPQTDSLAEAARKARAAKQEASKAPAKVFTNDDIPTSGGISAVGESSGESQASAGGSSSAGASSGSAYPDGNDEKGWRKLFDDLNHKLQQDQDLVDVSQRELGNLSVQYYSDPTKAMMQQLTRSDINKKTAAIEQHKKDVEADKQAISDAEDALRRAGGDPGWAPR